MTEHAETLTVEQKELVAVGASVGAGCHPCVRHHIKAAVKAGVDEQRVLAALATSDRIAAEAVERMGPYSREVLGAEPTARAAAASSLDDALAAFGAAIAANDAAAIKVQLLGARAAGASISQLEAAIETAANVQRNAARIHIREAERLLGQPAADPDETSDAACGSGEPAAAVA